MVDHRAEFDADVTFLNGGALQAQGFRLDVPGPDVDEADLAARFVGHLGLLMVDRVTLSGVRVFEEAHKGSRGAVDPPAEAEGGRRLVELNHVVRAGMVTYPGLPGPEITPHLTRESSREHYAEGTEFAIDRITLVGNTGTYLDSPFHRYPDGADLAGLPLDAVADLPATVVHLTGAATDRRGIDVAALAAVEVAGRAVLLHTGWDRHFGTERYAHGAPFLTGEAARWLVERGVRLVGIDSLNIDDAEPEAGGHRPAHSALLAAGVPIVEHLTGLDQLPATGARFTAAPLRIAAFGTTPTRAYASIPT
jgi:kynurenine formamidase